MFTMWKRLLLSVLTSDLGIITAFASLQSFPILSLRRINPQLGWRIWLVVRRHCSFSVIYSCTRGSVPALPVSMARERLRKSIILGRVVLYFLYAVLDPHFRKHLVPYVGTCWQNLLLWDVLMSLSTGFSKKGRWSPDLTEGSLSQEHCCDHIAWCRSISHSS